MKLRKFRGKSLPEVMLKIKETLGEDAVILSTKKVGSEIEVLAACDLQIDEEPRKQIELIETVKKEPEPELPIKQEGIELDRVLVEIEELKKLITAHINRENQIKELKKEIAQIKGILSEATPIQHVLDEEVLPIYNRLKEMEVDEKVINFVIKRISEEELLSPLAVCEEVLKNIIKTKELSPAPGVPIVFAGPTGVGKTTTLAKVASILKLYEGKEVAIISIDTFRIGAVDQLKIYADILEIDMFTANTPEEFQRFVSLLRDKILLVDTAGRSPKDSIRKEEMNTFLQKLEEYTLLIAIPYNYRLKEALQVMEEFSTKKPDGLILTKLDEAQIYGLPVNLGWHSDVPIIYITTGQRVPEDIEEASPRKMVEQILDEVGQ